MVGQATSNAKFFPFGFKGLNLQHFYLDIVDGLEELAQDLSFVFDFILMATGLFSVASRGLFAPVFLSKI